MILLTPGDPAGIGPLVALSAWSEAGDAHAVLCGDRRIWLRAAEQLGVDTGRVGAACIDGAGGGNEPLPDPGNPTISGAKMAWRALDVAIDRAMAERACAIVTGPISKLFMMEAGFPFPGHTEYLAERAGCEVLMVMSAPHFHVGLHTVHVPLAEVPSRIDADRLYRELLLLAGFAATLEERRPIAVCGLNPHAGENGKLGGEETLIEDAVHRAVADGLDVVGPLPGDTVFAAMREGVYGAAMAMFHDQGLAPFKLLHFRDGVNVTVGLPFVRTSPDHGTAFELANRVSAIDAGSAIASLALARRLCAAVAC